MKQKKLHGMDAEAAVKTPGLRERKRKKTRETIVSAAIRLFLEKGYEKTTLDDIAAAADVSRRSIFSYFASKEDIAFSLPDRSFPILREELDARPADEPWPTAIEAALDETAKRTLTAESLALIKLTSTTPALMHRERLKYSFFSDIFCKAIRDRSGMGGGDPRRVKLLAEIIAIEVCIAFSEKINACRSADDIVEKIRIDFDRLWDDLKFFGEEGRRAWKPERP